MYIKKLFFLKMDLRASFQFSRFLNMCVRDFNILLYISGDELRKIINKKDKHLVSVESLSVNQLKNELAQRGLSNKGKKGELVARLKEAVGNCKVVLCFG